MAFQNSAQPAAMYVRALYDYDSDDRTSLSFKQGDIIQVITQLESGWWDGIINDIRGWFPSNYCAIVEEGALAGDEHSVASTTDDEGEETRSSSQTTQADAVPLESRRYQEAEAAFWTPQITNDGRLYYYNTLTGESARELPLETPAQGENGPRDRMAVRVPDQTRPPAEMLAGGYYEREDEDTSASEYENDRIRAGRRRSQVSDGISPSASMESLNINHSPIHRQNGRSRQEPAAMGAYSATLLGQGISSTPRMFHDDGVTQPITWNRLVDNIRRSVESYRQAINNAERSEYVRKAEDISDNLRMILAAGSGTTDNHSGNPSVISANKALYPHFRDMMSRFSKLVLSSHMAAADWPAPDSYAKCLQEAEGVLHGVYGFVEVARSQQGENISRLIPGFVTGGNTGGNWQYHGIANGAIDNDDQDFNEPTVPLDGFVIERMDDLKRMIVSSIRRLEEHLIVQEKIITALRHEQISNTISTAAGKVVEYYRPYISTLESTNLAANTTASSPQFHDLMAQKQRLYDLIAGLVISAQAIGAPLSDEWANMRGEPLNIRMQDVLSITKDLEKCMSEIGFILQQMLQSPRQDGTLKANRQTVDGSLAFDGASHLRNASKSLQRPQLMETPHSFSEGVDPAQEHAINPKVKKFFGEVPVAGPPTGDEQPWYLKLDFDDELAYEMKSDSPQLKGGTLTALIEQLTRHDRPDITFNSTFLLTYRSFTTADELFDNLVKRFSIQPPRGITQDEYRVWIEKKQTHIRIRVVNVLKTWLDSYWMEDKNADSDALLLRIHTFAKDTIAKSATPGSGPLLIVIEQRIRGQEKQKKLVLNTGQAAPTPIVPKNMKRLKFLDIDVTEFARQLTIIESNLYGKIKPTECLNKTWHRKDEPDIAPNIKALILHSNQLTNWVAELILTQSDVKKRVVVIKHFVSVADKCRSLNNFSTLTSIISALGTAPIHRLNRTWAQVSQRTIATLEQMRNLMASTKNFGEYRPALHQANPPCIPFFGVYLTDLTFIEDGIPSIIKKTNLINFAKRDKTAEVIRNIQQYQNAPYSLTSVPELQEYILSNMQAAGDVHTMYDRSLQVEPREREDEKIARLLSESGFL